MVNFKRSRRSRKTTKRSTKRKFTHRKGRSVSNAVKSYVSRMVNTRAELKHATPINITNLEIDAYGTGANGPHQMTTVNLSSIFGTITQGSADGDRIGDKIRVKSFNLRGYVNLDSARANDEGYLKNPMLVKMFVGRRIDTITNPNTYVGTSTQGFEDFFRDGPLYLEPSNEPPDMYRYVNKDVYRIYATRFFKIGMSAPSNNPADSNQWNNDFKFSKNFNISLSKHINYVKFNSADVGATNVGFYVWFVVSWANGADVIDLSSKVPLECHMSVNCTYYDS